MEKKDILHRALNGDPDVMEEAYVQYRRGVFSLTEVTQLREAAERYSEQWGSLVSRFRSRNEGNTLRFLQGASTLWHIEDPTKESHGLCQRLIKDAKTQEEIPEGLRLDPTWGYTPEGLCKNCYGRTYRGYSHEQLQVFQDTLNERWKNR